MRFKNFTLFWLLTYSLVIVVRATLTEHGLQVEGEQIVKEADGENAVVEGDVVEELPKEAESIPRHTTGRLVNSPGLSSPVIAKRNALNPTLTNRWPNNTMFYQIALDPPMGYKEKRGFAGALHQYGKYTCVKLVSSDDAPYRLRIFRGKGCYSSLGRQRLWKQPQGLSLGKGCLYQRKTPMHEMMHALGVNHEQNRPDRDEYVYINFDNIRQSSRHNFNKKPADSVSLYGTEYSYDSIMHYGSNYFATDKSEDSIITIDPTEQDVIGKVTHFSFEDLQLLNRMYTCECGSDAPVCAGHSYLGPDCQCQCKQADLTPAPCDPCFEPSIACECQENGCDTVPHSTCSQDTKACECDADYVKIDIHCVHPSSISCPAVGVHCHCSLNDPSACKGRDENSVCNTDTDKCECSAGYSLQSGVCVDVSTIPCTVLGEACFCSHKPVSECRTNVDPHSGCDSNTDSCVCLGGYLFEDGLCIPDPNPGYRSDGEFLEPFISSYISTTRFTPAKLNDNSGNGWILKAKSSDLDDVAAFKTDTIALTGDWCVSLGFRLKSAKVSVGYSIDGGEWLWRGWENEEQTTYFVDISEFKVYNPSTIKFRIVAEQYKLTESGAKYWVTHIDPISIVPCAN